MKGSVRIIVSSLEIARLGPDKSFGDRALFVDGGRSATVITAEPTRLAMVCMQHI